MDTSVIESGLDKDRAKSVGLVTVKVCSKCRESKLTTEFSKDRAQIDGLQYRCKVCQRAACKVFRAANLETCRANGRKHYAENSDKYKAYARQYAANHPEQVKAHAAARDTAKANRDWRARNPEKARDLQEHSALMRRFKKYGLTLDQYHAMAEKQDFLCAVCGEEPPMADVQGKNYFDNFAIDHCHETKRVRGLTCTTCNVAVGMLRNSPAKAHLVAAYLLR